jgi:monoamine oxidase
MPKSQLMDSVRGLVAAQAPGSTQCGSVSRRQFLAALGASAAAIPIKASRQPSIAVVGAGLAGLVCAYRLQQAGYYAAVYEAQADAGGRCRSLRGHFDAGQIIERGGELIDQSHTEIRHLCQELGLPLDNVLAAEPNGTEPLYYFDDRPYSYKEATEDIKKIWQKLHRDLVEAGYPTTYYQSTARGRELDAMSIRDWIQESVPGGIDSRLGQLLDVAYTIEYGAESSEQSALNLIYLLGFSGQGRLRIFGPSNEKYKVRGGNDRIVSALTQRLAGQILYQHALAAVEQFPEGTFRLTFSTPRGRVAVRCDKVVLTVPFSILRTSVDLRRAGFRPLKMRAIAELGMGNNAKQHLQFTERHWAALGGNGDSFSDRGYQNTWEVTRAQSGRPGILVNYTGGATALVADKTPPSVTLAQIEPVMPGLAARWNGKHWLEYWPGNPWTKGSYSFWKVGQYQLFAGIEGEREGHCHFAGEHTSIDSQGYLNGAVESGERAALEIIRDLRSR